MAANIFNGSTDANWGTAANWSLGAVPTASDGNPATFDGTSPACTVNTSARVCQGLNFTGYTNTITMSQQITCSGSVTLNAGMTIAGSGALLVNATATLTSNGKAWPNALTIGGATFTATLADNWDVDGLMSIGITSNTVTVNGFQITCSAGFTHSGSTGIATGTTLLVFDGTGTMTGSSNSLGSLRMNVTINTAGTITLANGAGGTFGYQGATWTYTAGTVSATSTTLRIQSGSTTVFACNGMTWGVLNCDGNSTLTLNENLRCAGLVVFGSASTAQTINGNTLYCGAGLRTGFSGGSVNGTTIFEISGTGTLDMSGLGTGYFTAKIHLNAPGGTITITSIFRTDLGLVKYTAGTIVTTYGTWASGSGGPVSANMRGGFVN